MNNRITCKLWIVLNLSCILTTLCLPVFAQTIEPGKTWLDTSGKPIEAHGGGILKVGAIYYWYGENHELGLGNKKGISCYSSANLYNWKNEGVVFPKQSLPIMFQDSGVCERPKVLYNAKTKKYVMWMHLDANQYTVAMAGVAVSDSPAGIFKFLGYKRPINYDYGYLKEQRVPGTDSKEKELGNTFRDMALFQDDDGKAYVIYSSEELATLYVAKLNNEFTDIAQPAIKEKTWERILVGTFSEAPAPFKFKGKYYLIASATSGWDPNAAKLAVSDSIFGPWKSLGNPAVGKESETTFRSQSTYVLPAPGKTDGSFIYMGDRWIGSKLENSTYVWLPFKMNSAGGFELINFKKWDLSIFNGTKEALKAPQIKLKSDSVIAWSPIENANGYKVFKNGIAVSFTHENEFQIPDEFAGQVFNYTVVAWRLSGEVSKPSNAILKNWTVSNPLYLSDRFPESYHQGWGNLQKDKSIKAGINIGGKAFKKGLGTHAPSEIIYRVCGNYTTFSAWTGVDYFTKFSTEASVQFEVWADGVLYYQGKVMKVTDPAEFVKINITGINELKLIINDAGDGQGWDHANWADAKIE